MLVQARPDHRHRALRVETKPKADSYVVSPSIHPSPSRIPQPLTKSRASPGSSFVDVLKPVTEL